ncbi:hypothetical protein K505DRAFT_341422 [Melanomma pulvis-pyrius CBS 109.77]|uniref:F-box domain-containing protein n=1 Tax=Melanomma pulvis-pyrius CBS 109.77 TaxID=1314802 RepID=A0A6A6WYE1_9PLEO|nr:hypothetical protein K505DRAFT_341422 [Melanomma pulvis-pyrius CBS 109.77]
MTQRREGLVSLDIPEHLLPIAQKNSTNSPLLRLPAELRNKIYRYALGDMRIVIGSTGKSDITIGLPGTCRQIYAETGTMVYQLNVFDFVLRIDYLRDWAEHRLRSQLEAVRAIKVNDWYIMYPSKKRVPKHCTLPNLERLYVANPKSFPLGSMAVRIAGPWLSDCNENLKVIME